MPPNFDFSWASPLTDALTTALLVPLMFIREFLLEDIPKLVFYIFKVYFQCASIVLFTTIYCSALLLAGLVHYITFTFVWIYMTFRLCIISYAFYILGQSLRAICLFVVTSPVNLVLVAAGITQLPMLFKYAVPVLGYGRLIDRGIRATVFKLNALVATKKPRRIVVDRNTVVDQGTQTVEAWERFKERIRMRELARLDRYPYSSDEWETDSEDERE